MEVYKFVLLFVVFGAVSVLGQYDRYEVKTFRNCEEAKLCCDGVNNKCYVPNARKMDGSIGNCFCDTKCLQMNDCCTDFRSHCKGRQKSFFFLFKKTEKKKVSNNIFALFISL